MRQRACRASAGKPVHLDRCLARVRQRERDAAALPGLDLAVLAGFSRNGLLPTCVMDAQAVAAALAEGFLDGPQAMEILRRVRLACQQQRAFLGRKNLRGQGVIVAGLARCFDIEADGRRGHGTGQPVTAVADRSKHALSAAHQEGGLALGSRPLPGGEFIAPRLCSQHPHQPVPGQELLASVRRAHPREARRLVGCQPVRAGGTGLRVNRRQRRQSQQDRR